MGRVLSSTPVKRIPTPCHQPTPLFVLERHFPPTFSCFPTGSTPQTLRVDQSSSDLHTCDETREMGDYRDGPT